MSDGYYGIRECYYCGPRQVHVESRKFDAQVNQHEIVCPTCGLDNGEIHMIELVREIGFEEALRREARRATLRSN